MSDEAKITICLIFCIFICIATISTTNLTMNYNLNKEAIKNGYVQKYENGHVLWCKDIEK